MSEREDRDLAALDAYVRSQLAKAAETYASHVNLDARLAAVLQAAEQEHEDPAVPDKLGAAKQLEPERSEDAARDPWADTPSTP